MKLARKTMSLPAAAERERPPPPQPVAVARTGAGKSPAGHRREPPKLPLPRPKLSDFEQELLAAWDS
jgi:hypothetical protein